MPGLWARSPVGGVPEATDRCVSHTVMFLSLSFFLPSPLSKNNFLKRLRLFHPLSFSTPHQHPQHRLSLHSPPHAPAAILCASGLLLPLPQGPQQAVSGTGNVDGEPWRTPAAEESEPNLFCFFKHVRHVQESCPRPHPMRILCPGQSEESKNVKPLGCLSAPVSSLITCSVVILRRGGELWSDHLCYELDLVATVNSVRVQASAYEVSSFVQLCSLTVRAERRTAAGPPMWGLQGPLKGTYAGSGHEGIGEMVSGRDKMHLSWLEPSPYWALLRKYTKKVASTSVF